LNNRDLPEISEILATARSSSP